MNEQEQPDCGPKIAEELGSVADREMKMFAGKQFESLQQPGLIKQREYIRAKMQQFSEFVKDHSEHKELSIDGIGSYLLSLIKKGWDERTINQNQKSLTLQLTNPKISIETICTLLGSRPSIRLQIQGQKVSASEAAVFHKQGDIYCEGTCEDMFIYRKNQDTRYIGNVDSLKNPQYHGKGVLFTNLRTPLAALYMGEFKDNRRQGFGYEKMPFQIYEGQWKDDQKSGQGTEYVLMRRKKKQAKEIECQDQITDTKSEAGGRVANKDHNQSTKVMERKVSQGLPKNINQAQGAAFQYKSIFKGKFREGLRNGEGREQTRYGEYLGWWEHGMKNKHGVIRYKNGEKYEGEWRDNKICGEGEYLHSSGDIYIGQFEEGFRNGQGIMKYRNGDSYEGEWKDGLKHGKGVYRYQGGEDYFDGYWAYDSAEGEGTAMIDQTFFTGTFSKGKRHGKGEQIDAEGNTTVGIWKYNKLIAAIQSDHEQI